VDILKLMEEGHNILQARRAEAEKAKAGNMRAGSAGCIGPDNAVYGNCHRKSLARLLGVDKAHDIPTQVMFQGGEQNEVAFMQVIKESWPGKILCDVEIPISFDVPGGKVTGRPDMVLCDADGKPQFVIEHKGVFSTSTATSVWLGNEPKSEHLAQLSTYAAALGVPGAICYTNRSYIPVDNFFDKKKYPGAKKIAPFYKIFYIQFAADGFLEYRADNANDFTKTNISFAGIKDYYTLVAEMRDNKVLGPRPSENDVMGNKLKWAPCRYCDFKNACDNHENSFDQWIEAVKL